VTTRVLGTHGTLPQGDEKRRAVEKMFDRVAPRYDRMNQVVSLGLAPRWRRRAVQALRLPAGSRVLDLACGTGDLCIEMARAGVRPVGVDFSAGMLAAARTHAPLVRADAEKLPFADGSLDGVICGFALRNFVALDAVFSECARILRRDGRFVALDAAVPTNPVLRLGNAVWFRGAVPLLGLVLTRNGEAYRYLPRSTAYLPTREVLVGRLGSAGFAPVAHTSMTGGSVLVLEGTRT
jgi:demethylmenaquinone methyltransferase / 2-methoxy-6-polyprenyl-1,4-benzoquinol methylase